MENLLSIQDLTIAFRNGKQVTWAASGITLTLKRGEVVALVGESGSGKSITALSILGLLPKTALYPSGRILFSKDGDKKVNLLRMQEAKLRNYRGADIAMIFQEPMTSLNPVFTCGEQVMETIRKHRKTSRKEARMLTLSLFEKVQLPDPEEMLNRYPHQLSGGQKQRVMIAIAISCNPSLLIADEPTTALDVTVQKHILQLLASIREEYDMGMLFITHDLGVVQEIAHRVLVMYKGNIVESGTVDQIFNQPNHPYTKALLSCRPGLQPKGLPLPVVSDFWDGNTSAKPSIRTAAPGVMAKLVRENTLTGLTIKPDAAGATIPAADVKPLLQVENLSVWYPGKKNWLGKPKTYIKAVDDISFDVFEGETLGIVGESGCGKSTLGRAILRLVPAQSGTITHQGRNLLELSRKEMSALRQELQLVFQDPYSSLNPRKKVGDAILEPMAVHRTESGDFARRERVGQLLSAVNLPISVAGRYPHAFSGGQRQRIGIARALALRPGFIVFDESVSALDVSVQAQVLNLFNRLKKEMGFTAIFISHDLGVVRYISDRILVMEKGKIAEIGASEAVFNEPTAAYTRKLLEAIPINSIPSRPLNIMP